MCLQEVVDDLDGDEEGFRHEFVLLVNFLQPAQKDSSHVLAEILLLWEVVDGLAGRLAGRQYIVLDLGSIVGGLGGGGVLFEGQG